MSGCRKRRSAKGARSLFFVFGTVSVTFWSLFLMLPVTFLVTPFAELLLPNSFCGRVAMQFHGNVSWRSSGELSGPFCLETPYFRVWRPQNYLRVPNGVFQTVFFRFLTSACDRGKPLHRDEECLKTPVFKSILVLLPLRVLTTL